MPSILGKEVGDIGYGLMHFTWRSNPAGPEEYTKPMETALARGSNFWNGGELYGVPEHNSLHMLRDYFRAHPGDAEKVVLSIKGSLVPGQLTPDNSKENLTRSVDECLRVLDGTKVLDIFEPARIDSVHPVEETIAHLAEFVKAGKIKGIGLSHVDAETIRRAHKIHPIAAVEVLLHLGDREIIKNGVAATCAELGIPIVAYSPLGSGVLTGRIKSVSDIPEGDVRHHFATDAKLKATATFVQRIGALAEKKNLTTAQFSLTWLRSLSAQKDMPTIIPIPGSTNASRVVENTVDVPLFTAEDMAEIEGVLDEMDRAGVISVIKPE